METRYLWCGQVLCQARDGQDRIIRRYYPQGELQGNTKLYYARDQLGSVADAVDGTGFPLGSSDYSAYGQTVKQTGTPTDRGYAGMFRHAQSGLYLTLYRAYDPRTGRWLSRDPIGEAGGVNLYAYVGNNPVTLADPDGLLAVPVPAPTHCGRNPRNRRL
ncbi:RHS repeat-associated core domain-containing protein [Methylococcus sp. ANG]|uniref:RHS repeat-associated core domain-containing protein n=1 Tax=Methylococcus sp. ANG TaxID=3231903 RepID=UPI00345AC3E5